MSTKRALLAAVAAGSMVLTGSALSAQTTLTNQTDARWQGWLGCWQPVAPISADGDLPLQGSVDGQQLQVTSAPVARAGANTPVVCVVPAAASATSGANGSAVDVATVVGGKVVARESIDATGQRMPLAKDGCNGWKSATWSADGKRVYLTSELACPGGLNRTSNGLFAMSPGGDWLDVEGAAMSANGGNSNAPVGVRVLRYRNVGTPSIVPADIAKSLNAYAATASAQRTAAGAPLTTASVAEAARHLDPAVEAAWLIERGQGFALNADQLVKLADAGVPGSVTDVMVALSYPKAFAMNPETREGDLLPAGAVLTPGGLGRADGYARGGRNIDVVLDPYYSPFYSPYYSPYGYSPYGSSYSRYGYSPYGYGYGGGYGYYWNRQPTVIILKGNEPATGGRMVKGRGFTQSNPGSSNDAPRTVHRNTDPESSAGTRSGSTPPPPPAPTRTAKPRP